MKRLSLLAILTFARLAYAEPAAGDRPPPPDTKKAEAVVQRVLVQPLAAKERDQSKFSRARLPAAERRVRILDGQARQDADGGTFYTFAIDARHGMSLENAAWQMGTVTGCVYVDRGEVFVKSGERHRPAAFLLGKNLKPVAEGICHGDVPAMAMHSH